MTRDQLIAKRKKKKRFRRIAVGAAVLAAGLVIFGTLGIVRSSVKAPPGDLGVEELSEVDGIISVIEEPDEADEIDEIVVIDETDSIIPFVESTVSSVPAEPRWESSEAGTFYYYPDGSMATGLVDIDGARYYFGFDGVMLTGWQEDDGNLYYFSPEDGKAVTGEVEIDGKKYWFDEDGVNDPSKTVSTAPEGGAMVALTFDDGPGYYTNDLLDLLEQYNAKATFFMIGQEVENYPSAVLREHEMGMEQGNHSWDHKTLTHLSPEDIEWEFRKTNDTISSITGDSIELFRAPGGGLNDDVYANSLGMKSILWSIDTLDWETKNAQQTYDTVINNVQDGDIILMHEIYEASLNAAKMIIPKLQEMGYQLVTVSELAAAKGVSMETGVSYAEFW